MNTDEESASLEEIAHGGSHAGGRKGYPDSESLVDRNRASKFSELTMG